VRAPLSGVVERVHVRQGQDVRSGQLLATISSRDAASVRSDLRRAAVQEEVARSAVLSLRDLVKTGAATTRELHEAEVRLQHANSELARARAAAASLGVGSLGVATYALRATQPGRVLTRHCTPGEHIGPDDAQEAFFIGDLERLEIVARAPERDAGDIELGDAASIELLALPDAALTARVVSIGPVVDAVSRTVPIRLRLDPGHPPLAAEMSAVATLETVGSEVIVVPAEAVMMHADDFVVLVRSPTGAYERRSVRPGIRIAHHRQILAGLAVGEQVVTEGALLLDPELDRILAP